MVGRFVFNRETHMFRQLLPQSRPWASWSLLGVFWVSPGRLLGVFWVPTPLGYHMGGEKMFGVARCREHVDPPLYPIHIPYTCNFFGSSFVQDVEQSLVL